MIESPQIVQSAAQHTACIHVTIPWEEITDVMGPGIMEVMAIVAEQGIPPAGPWLTHHLAMDPDTADFEICVPVTRPVAPQGRVKPGMLRAAKVARTVYHGEYEGLPGAWEEFTEWLESHGHEGADDLWECYTKGPEASDDPADWRTELNKPLSE